VARRASFASFLAVFLACLNSWRAFLKRSLAERASSFAALAALADARAVARTAESSEADVDTARVDLGFFITQTDFLIRSSSAQKQRA
jgi:hypothetical protein